MTKTKEEIITEAIRIRQEIMLIFNSADHWNRTHPDEEPIDPDPDGKLRRLEKGLHKMLVHGA